MTLLRTAYLIGRAAHEATGQKRKYTGEPYFVHCEEVRGTLANFVPDDVEVQAAAYLHDVLEDTAVTEAFLRAQVGDVVTDLVLEVTDVSKPDGGNRAARKALDRVHLAKASGRGQTLKLADLIDNTRSIAQHDPLGFAPVYLREKSELLTVLTRGDVRLMQLARQTLAEGWAQVQKARERAADEAATEHGSLLS